MQGIFQYNNVLGLPSQCTATTHRRSLCPIQALENQHVSPSMGGNTDVHCISMMPTLNLQNQEAFKLLMGK
jgi:hypothetical protein